MGDTTNRIAGVAFLSVDGVTYPLEGALTYTPTKRTRETKTGQDTVHGYGEMPTPGKIGGSIRDSGGLTVGDFNDMTNVTIVLQLANGKTVTGRNMWTVDAQEVDTVEAKFEVKWEGPEGCVVED